MALIGKIRKNSWLLIVLIGIGLGGFVVMDIMSSANGPIGGGAQMLVGTVNGEKINRMDFERKYELLYSNSTGNTYANRQNLWQYMVNESLVEEEATALGMDISREELLDLQFGDNPSPIILRNFPNPSQPGTVDRNQLNQIKQLIETNGVEEAILEGQLNPAFVSYWRMQEGQIITERLQSKLGGLVSKAFYTPSWMAEMEASAQGDARKVAYVRIPYSEIPNEEVSVSDADLEDYLEQHQVKYELEEDTRELAYVSFDVLPTEADSAAIREELLGLVDDFRTAKDDSAFVLRYDGSISPAYSLADELSAAVADTAFALPAGSVYGPYFEQGSYKLMKVRNRAVMADSADSRHILIGINNPLEEAQAEQTTDSLFAILQADRTQFDTLAAQFSTDPGSAQKGGLYEAVTPGQFVPEYDDILFRTGVIGQLYKVRSQFGWHIIEVLDRSESTQERVQTAYIVESVIPSKDTQDSIFQAANEFLANYTTLEELRTAVEGDLTLRMESSGPLTINDFQIGTLGFGNDTRDMVCWAFSASIDEVSPAVYTFTEPGGFYDSKYVIAALSGEEYAGLPSVESVREEVELLVVNAKKADILKERVGANPNLQVLAANFQLTVDTAASLNFTQSFIPGLGNEPKVIAAAARLPIGQVSEVIVGESGVFVVQPIETVSSAVSPIDQIKQQLTQSARSLATNQFLQSLRATADVEDMRSTVECANQ